MNHTQDAVRQQQLSQTLDQERAQYAWTKVVEVTENFQDFKRVAEGAPALVMSNGLMQALAFYKHKNHDALLEAVLEWVRRRVFPDAQVNPQADLFVAVMERLTRCDADEYFRATEEALAILGWIREFAKARDSRHEPPQPAER